MTSKKLGALLRSWSRLARLYRPDSKPRRPRPHLPSARADTSGAAPARFNVRSDRAGSAA